MYRQFVAYAEFSFGLIGLMHQFAQIAVVVFVTKHIQKGRNAISAITVLIAEGRLHGLLNVVGLVEQGLVLKNVLVKTITLGRVVFT